MDCTLDYGRNGLPLTLAEDLDATVVEPQKGAPLGDPAGAVGDALARPIGTAALAELARGKRSAAVVISDKTRPVPYRVVLPPLLRQIEAGGVRRGAIEIVVATGLHRGNTRDELVEMVGGDVVERYRIRNHDARAAETHRYRGRTGRGTEVWIDTGFLDAELKVITGLIEPHLMAGYSGGRKAVAPGLAAVDTMRSLHGAAMLEGHIGPGILEGNPFHADLLEIARLVGPDFLLDVAIDRQRRLTGVFAGDFEAAHAAGVSFVEPHVLVRLERAADVVITSAGGYPLDATLYQAIKGLTASLNIVRRGGTVILAAEISEGLGSAEFEEMLLSTRSADDFMRRITSSGFFRIDQWMMQHLCQVLRKAQVILVSDRLSATDRSRLFLPTESTVGAALASALQRHGRTAHIAVVPQGPYVLTTVRGRRLALGTAWRDAA
jgi:nickel-dependent lactate racemase